jgi:hypothetical protein
VDVRRLGPVTGVEEGPVGASPEHGRHAERCHGERAAAMAQPRDAHGRHGTGATSERVSPPNESSKAAAPGISQAGGGLRNVEASQAPNNAAGRAVSFNGR